MNLKRFSPIRSRSKSLFLLPSLIFLSLMMTSTGTMPTVHSAAFTQETGERQFRIARRSDHPIAIKQIRNAQSDRFLHDVEVEIQNVSNKPVYYVSLYIRFPDIEVMPNVHYANTMEYGDPRLFQASQLPGPQDKPIPPGGTVTLTIPKGEWSGFEGYQHEKQLPRAATNRVEIYLEEVNFGDGTNYEWDRPEHRPRPSKNNPLSKPKAEVLGKQLVNAPDDSRGMLLAPLAASYITALKKTLRPPCRRC